MTPHSHFTPAEQTPSLSSTEANTSTREITIEGPLLSDFEHPLDHVIVLPAKKFIIESFGRDAWVEEVPPEVKEAFERINPEELKDDDSSDNEESYLESLTEAFNSCCLSLETRTCKVDHHFPRQKLCCLNLYSRYWLRGEEVELDAQMGPDMFLTFDYKSPPKSNEDTSPTQNKPPIISPPSSLFELPGIVIEVTAGHNTDLCIDSRSTLSESASDHDKEKRSPTKAQIQLLSQAFGCIAAGHWSSSPYRFIFCITIAGDLLHIWRYSSSGVIATEAIEYASEPNAIYSLLQAIGISDYSALGLDVGKGQTFQQVNDESIKKKMQEAIAVYAKSTLRLEDWSTTAANQPLWKFECPGERWRNPRYTEKEQSFIVVSHPIFASARLFGRSTRCYLAASEDSLKEGILTISELRTIKICWQPVSHIHEAEQYRQATNSGSDNDRRHIAHLSTVIAGGGLDDTLQYKGRFIRVMKSSSGKNGYTFVSPIPRINKADASESLSGKLRQDKWIEGVPEDTKELRWTVIKEVAGRSSTFRSPKELLHVMTDIVTAHEALFDRGVLHRDISASNVMIDLNNSGAERDGLLIDLDMASNLEEREGAEEEATLFEEGIKLAKDKSSILKLSENMVAAKEELILSVRMHSTESKVQARGNSVRSARKPPIVEDPDSDRSDSDEQKKATAKGKKKTNTKDDEDEYLLSEESKSRSSELPKAPEALFTTVNGKKEEAEKGRAPITGTLMFMAIALVHRPTHRFWHDLESIYYVFVFLICRHFQAVTYWDGDKDTVMQVTTKTIQERQELLRTIFPPGSLRQRSSTKMQFLNQGRIETPEYNSITTMIGTIHSVFDTLYKAIESAHKVCQAYERISKVINSKDELRDLTGDKLIRWITPPKGSFYSISDYQPLDELLVRMSEISTELKGLTGPLQHKLKTQVKDFNKAVVRFESELKLAKQDDFPSHQWMRELFEEACQQTPNDGVGPYHFEPRRETQQSISKSSQPPVTPLDLNDSPHLSQGLIPASKSSGSHHTSMSAPKAKRKKSESRLGGEKKSHKKRKTEAGQTRVSDE